MNYFPSYFGWQGKSSSSGGHDSTMPRLARELRAPGEGIGGADSMAGATFYYFSFLAMALKVGSRCWYEPAYELPSQQLLQRAGRVIGFGGTRQHDATFGTRSSCAWRGDQQRRDHNRCDYLQSCILAVVLKIRSRCCHAPSHKLPTHRPILFSRRASNFEGK